MYTETQLAFSSMSLPCNPTPFLKELMELVNQQGVEAIKTDGAKMFLMTILLQSFGGFGLYDIPSEFSRLYVIAKTQYAE